VSIFRSPPTLDFLQVFFLTYLGIATGPLLISSPLFQAFFFLTRDASDFFGILFLKIICLTDDSCISCLLG